MLCVLRQGTATSSKGVRSQVSTLSGNRSPFTGCQMPASLPGRCTCAHAHTLLSVQRGCRYYKLA